MDKRRPGPGKKFVSDRKKGDKSSFGSKFRPKGQGPGRPGGKPGKPAFSADPDELAPPRFLKKFQDDRKNNDKRRDDRKRDDRKRADRNRPGGFSGRKQSPDREREGDRRDKPFRPKYDPQVPRPGKGYSARKKALLGEQDHPDDIRLNKYIANAGICSRREADTLIAQGLVSVNGTVITEMGYRVKKGDEVRYDGRRILPEPYVYILMNKPKDFITTTDDEKDRKTVIDLLAGKIPQRVFPIGRLDRNTTGVLLLTNDGEVTQVLTHPSFNIKKVYHVVLDRKVSGQDLDKLVEGVELDDGKAFADAATFIDNEDRRHVGVEIHSGRNRIVRRMFEHLGYEVEKLDRVSMGIFTKKDLPRGKWRFLSDSETSYLLKLKSGLS